MTIFCELLYITYPANPYNYKHLPLVTLVNGRCVLPEPIGWLCLQLDFPPSVAELFRLPSLKSGTL